MPGFSTPEAAAAAPVLHMYLKKVTGAVVAGPWTVWHAANGTVGAGTNPTAGKSNGRVCTRATTGALAPFINAPAGATLWLSSAMICPVSTGSLQSAFLLDRVSDCNLAVDEGSGAITGVTATSRLEAASGGVDDGCLVMSEITSTFPAGQNTFTFDYVGADGENATSPELTTTANGAVGQGAFGTQLFLPLATQSRGVRQITAITKTGGSATGGTFNLVLVRRVLVLPLLIASLATTRRNLIAFPNLRKLWNDSCLFVAGFSNGTFATTLQINLKASLAT